MYFNADPSVRENTISLGWSQSKCKLFSIIDGCTHGCLCLLYLP